MEKDKQRSKNPVIGALIVGFMFMGMGVGLLVGNLRVGIFVGMGVGLLAAVVFKILNK